MGRIVTAVFARSGRDVATSWRAKRCERLGIAWSLRSSERQAGEALTAAVVVPLYRERLDRTEAIALTQCCRVLGRHAIVFVAPEKLDVDAARAIAGAAAVAPRIERFSASWFRSTGTYNALLLSRPFYERFAACDYILIHQLDAFVFSDALDRFCELGYDYIGAPWSHHTPARRCVGNGGFSLRKVSAALRVLGASKVSQGLALAWRRHALLRSTITRFFEQHGRLDRIMQSDAYLPLALTHLLYVNEDGFWGQNCDKLPFFATAPYDDALAFAFEIDPETALVNNAGALPFGCHAWPMTPAFWGPHINRFGYDWDGAA
jgi:hypothetical protein